MATITTIGGDIDVLSTVPEIKALITHVNNEFANQPSYKIFIPVKMAGENELSCINVDHIIMVSK